MAKVRTLGPGSLTIGSPNDGRNLAVDCTNVSLTPDTSTDDELNFLDGHSEAGDQTVTWTLEGTIKEDFSMNGTAVWAFRNQGNELPFTFIPSNSGSVKWQGTLQVSPIGVGGDVKTKNDQDFSFTVRNLTPLDINEELVAPSAYLLPSTTLTPETYPGA